ncbi:addiction module toxin RelE [Saccharibacillus alkalitolerans]|uniref:Addiction module toxin RelE n=1 Tax=Saccharibacillus alkalitolerans TaxID=2705290 RepID=A0ABX0FAM6_9BACL|nr:addiction module toxin RelE [Saccharibacillus alkalitolerans]NGZ77986.1 addiction module toxin RelE [Saccharibacillus alkalitolerans]
MSEGEIEQSRKFVELSSFTSAWRQLGLTEDDLLELETILMKSPKAAPVIRGTGGLRKIRFAPSHTNKGKSGSYRVTYLDIDQEFLIILLVVFNKSESDNLSQAERNNLKKIVERLKTYYGGD